MQICSGVRARLRVPEEMHIQRRARGDPRDAHPVSAEHSDLCGLWFSNGTVHSMAQSGHTLSQSFLQSSFEILALLTSSIPSTESGEGESVRSPCEVASLSSCSREEVAVAAPYA